MTPLGPVGHTVVSVGIGGAVWAATGSPAAVPAATVTGVLIDVDHVLDYYNCYWKRDKGRLYVLFHGWEYSAIALAIVLAFWYPPVLLAAVLGHLGHLVGDQVGNRLAHPLAYSIVYRISAGFDRVRLAGEVPATFSEAFSRIPLWPQLEPVVLRLVSRLGITHRPS